MDPRERERDAELGSNCVQPVLPSSSFCSGNIESLRERQTEEWKRETRRDLIDLGTISATLSLFNWMVSSESSIYVVFHMDFGKFLAWFNQFLLEIFLFIFYLREFWVNSLRISGTHCLTQPWTFPCIYVYIEACLFCICDFHFNFVVLCFHWWG